MMPLPTADIVTANGKKHASSDSSGHFTLDHLCLGKCDLHIQLVGYTTLDTVIHIQKNANLIFYLKPSKNSLQSVTVIGFREKRDQLLSIPDVTISGEELALTRGLSLGESLKTLPGVNSLQSGPTISKPVIHGLYSNRILILNNGIRQEGQNWGNDHAPEIDPFIANVLSVVKGPSSLRYGSDAIGGVVLVDVPKLKFTPGIDGEVNLVGMTNGRSGTASAMLQGGFDKKLAGLAWRLQGTLEKAGNSRAAHYYIPNTGFSQRDYSASVGYQKQHYGATVYYSRFLSTIGLTPTSQDLTYADFQAAIKRGTPDPALNYFTYKIPDNSARQTIDHALLKADAYWENSTVGRFDLVAARQGDLRKEFGLDPLTYTDIPDNKYNLKTYTGDLAWSHPEWINGLKGSFGVSYMKQQNNIASRENVEVIPSYDNHSTGVYLIEKYQLNRLLLEGGIRYDSKYQQSHLFRRGNALQSTTDRIYDSTSNWKRTTANIGATYMTSNHFVVMYNLGTAWRGPSPIELFANGVHMGASRWEVGDPNLQVESALNNNLTLKYNDQKLSVEVGFYANFFHNYIYIYPNGTKQTVSGTYPLYQYMQTPKALFTGLDIDATWHFLPKFALESKTSIVRGRNQSAHDWLIYIPADRLDNSLHYNLPTSGGLKNTFVEINNLFVLKQTRIPSGVQDAPAPSAYDLWGMAMGTTVHIGKQPLNLSLSATNLLNKEYKDYLNLFRYYNHDLGRNIALRINIPLDFNRK